MTTLVHLLASSKLPISTFGSSERGSTRAIPSTVFAPPWHRPSVLPPSSAPGLRLQNPTILCRARVSATTRIRAPTPKDQVPALRPWEAKPRVASSDGASESAPAACVVHVSASWRRVSAELGRRPRSAEGAGSPTTSAWRRGWRQRWDIIHRNIGISPHC